MAFSDVSENITESSPEYDSCLKISFRYAGGLLVQRYRRGFSENITRVFLTILERFS